MFLSCWNEKMLIAVFYRLISVWYENDKWFRFLVEKIPKKKKNHSFKDDVHCFIHNVMLHNISYVAISGFAGGGYEVYDSYTGNVTVLMGPAPGHYPAPSHYPPMGHHPMLAAMSYQPMPYDWFNPSNVPANDQWMYNRHHHKKSTPTADAQQVRWFSLFSFSKCVEKIHLFGNNLSFVKLWII